jgi:thiol-disulfide isomerase/thioredoxin
MRTSLLCALLCAVGFLPALDVGDKAPALSGVTIVKGEPTQALDAGTVSVVEFWATWCGPCRETIPHLTSIQAAHPELQIIGLSDEDADTVKPFVEEMGAKMVYRVGLADAPTYASYMQGVQGIPHAVIVDGTGIVVWSGHPMEMESVLTDVLAGTFDVAKAKQISAAQNDLQESLSGRSPDLPRAKKAIATLLAINPVDQRAIDLRIAIAKHEENPAEVRAALEAVPVEQLTAEAANALAWERAVDEDLGSRHLDIALAFIDHGLTLKPGEAALIDTRARILYALGALDLAIAEQERACALEPDSEGMQETLANYRAFASIAKQIDGAAPAPTAPKVEAVVP